MLAFIDQVVIPFLDSLYGAVGYLGVMLAMTIESAMIPLPSELILPYAGFLVSDPSKLEPITGQAWAFWIVVILATLGNTIGSLIAYAIGAWGGRPLLERYGRYVLIRPHDIELADKFFLRWGPATVFIGRLLPIVRTFISLPAGVAKMPFWRFTFFTLLGCVPFVTALALLGHLAGANWEKIQRVLAPFSLLILAAIVVLAIVYVARRWRNVRAEYAALDAAKRD